MLAAQWRSAALGLTVAVTTPFTPYCQAVEMRHASAPGTAAEELVYARADDGIVDAGALFTPRGSVEKRIAVIWIHGSGVNFYYPSYVNVARELARSDLTTIVGNTRMHELGSNPLAPNIRQAVIAWKWRIESGGSERSQRCGGCSPDLR